MVPIYFQRFEGANPYLFVLPLLYKDEDALWTPLVTRTEELTDAKSRVVKPMPRAPRPGVSRFVLEGLPGAARANAENATDAKGAVECPAM